MIVASAIALLAAPLIVLRRRTLATYYGAAGATGLFAFLLWRRLPSFDPRLGCIAVAAITLAILSVLIARGGDVRWSATRAAVLAALVYALAIPTIGRHPLDGDEPYYLLVTESVARDLDLDLRNQYREHARGPQLNDPTGARGEQYSRHEPFLSLLMLPGFALAGTYGAIATIALFGVLLVRSTVRWMEDEGVADEHVRAVFPLFAFAPPVLYYAARIWPEVPAAFFFVEALRGVRSQRAQRWIPALLGLVLLKLRFVLVAVGLVATIAVRVVRARGAGSRGAIRNVSIAALVLLVPLVILYLITGSATNVHSWRELVPSHPRQYVRGFFGLLVDGMSGIAFQAPFYLLGLGAVTRWRSTPRGFRTGMLAAVLYILYLLPRAEWFGGWSPPLRYIVFLMPVLALGAASVWDRVSRGFVAVAALWSIGVTVHAMTYPWRLFHIASGENAVGEWLSTVYRSDFTRLFPSFIRVNGAAWIGAAAVVLLIVWSVRMRAEQRAAAPLVIATFALALSAAFHLGRQPGSRIEFEDTHIIRDGGELYPEQYQMLRVAYRGGWVLEAGESLSFLARAGTYTLDAITGLGATLELEGRAYHIQPHVEYQRLQVVVPRDARVTLRCLSGAINLDRMIRERAAAQ